MVTFNIFSDMSMEEKKKLCQGLCGIDCKTEIPTDTLNHAKFGLSVLTFASMQKHYKKTFPSDWKKRLTCEFNRVKEILISKYHYSSKLELKFYDNAK